MLHNTAPNTCTNLEKEEITSTSLSSCLKPFWNWQTLSSIIFDFEKSSQYLLHNRHLFKTILTGCIRCNIIIFEIFILRRHHKVHDLQILPSFSLFNKCLFTYFPVLHRQKNKKRTKRIQQQYVCCALSVLIKARKLLEVCNNISKTATCLFTPPISGTEQSVIVDRKMKSL